ncbi:MAG: alginate lyase family protein [Planctomycetota bacterium]
MAQEGRGEVVPETFLYRGADLAAVAKRISSGDQRLAAAVSRLQDEADSALTKGPFSVVNKPMLAPSGDRHDYFSHAIYVWPDPNKPDGLPWRYHDGRPNPEARKYDKGWLDELASASETLSLAGYLLGERKYSDRAALLIQTWFIAPETRQNPHFKYADVTPGKPDSGGPLITMSLTLPRIVESTQLLKAVGSWPEEDERALQKWFSEYLEWAEGTPYVAHNRKKNHNHITHYDLQAITIYRYIGRDDVARVRVEAVAGHQIAGQILPTGEMPQETRRTKSKDYTIMNLRGLMELAELERPLGVDLWSFRTDDGRCIRAALDYLVHHLNGDRPWPHEQIEPSNPDKLIPVLHLASRAWNDPEYEQILRKLVAEGEVRSHRVNLLFPRQ